jgi:hypothetical protein
VDGEIMAMVTCPECLWEFCPECCDVPHLGQSCAEAKQAGRVHMLLNISVYIQSIFSVKVSLN